MIQEVMQGVNLDTMVEAQKDHALPPEVMSAVFAGMALQDLIPFRRVR
jgi:hypothetical protein